MKRTIEDIRENMPFAGCDNETALEMCDEIERLQAAESELFDKCGELQKRVWTLEAAKAGGGS